MVALRVNIELWYKYVLRSDTVPFIDSVIIVGLSKMTKSVFYVQPMIVTTLSLILSSPNNGTKMQTQQLLLSSHSHVPFDDTIGLAAVSVAVIHSKRAVTHHRIKLSGVRSQSVASFEVLKPPSVMKLLGGWNTHWQPFWIIPNSENILTLWGQKSISCLIWNFEATVYDEIAEGVGMLVTILHPQPIVNNKEIARSILK